jgi:hypothetical protein
MTSASRSRELYSQRPELVFHFTVRELAQPVKLLTYILEVHVSNLGRDTGYSESFSAFIHTLQANADIVRQIWLQPVPPTSLPIHYLLIIRSFDAI